MWREWENSNWMEVRRRSEQRGTRESRKRWGRVEEEEEDGWMEKWRGKGMRRELPQLADRAATATVFESLPW